MSIDEDGEGATDMTSPAIRNALQLLCDEAGFLVEQKLDRLLAPLDRNERSLMKLDSIFKALGVETEADIHRLASYFVVKQPQPDGSGGDGGGAADAPAEGRMSALISPDEVGSQLRSFVEDFRRSKGLDQRPDEPEVEGDRRNRGFWEALVQTHPKAHEDVWGVLSGALKDYGEVLKDRAQALDDCDSLQVSGEPS
jgi:dynein regulatory complex protein 1